MNTNTKYPTTEYAKKLLYKYIPKNKKDKKGLFLLPLQTGSGKTHATIKHIKSKIKSSKKELFIYIVNTKHNVRATYNDLIKELDDAQRQEVLLLQNNYEMLIDVFKTKKDEIDNFKYLSGIDEFKTLKSRIDYIIDNQKSRNYNDDKTLIERDESELKQKLHQIFSNDNIKNEDKLREEIAIIYPTTVLDRYKTIFMTTSKFYHSMFNLEGGFKIYKDDRFKNATLFIDEFDTQKKILLDIIVDENIKHSYEFVELFRILALSLKHKRFSKKYNIDIDIFEVISKEFNEIYTKYNMQCSFKYDIQNDSTYESILMDNTISNVISTNNDNKKIDVSKADSKNTVFITNKGELEFIDFLRESNVILNRFIGLLKKVLRDKIDEDIKKQKDGLLLSFESRDDIQDRLLHDLLKELGISSDTKYYKYFKEIIQKWLYSLSKRFKSKSDEFYERGFKLINITQYSKHSNTSNFEFFELNNTPERFMKEMSKRFFVVGISATATIESLTKNFDLKYLRDTTNLTTINNDEINTMQELYLDAKKQRDRAIGIEYIKVSSISKEIVDKYFKKDGLEFELLEHFKTLLSNKDTNYSFKRLIRLVHSYKEFLLQDEIESFLAFMSAKIDIRKELLNSIELAKLIYFMLEANYKLFNKKIQLWIDELELKKKELKERDFFKYLVDKNKLFYLYTSDSDNKDRYKQMFKQEIKAKGKVFVISTYQTIGVGANLDYIDKLTKQIKDYDAIYLDTPTSFTEYYLHGDNAKEKQIKALYTLEVLFTRGYFSFNEHARYTNQILKLPKYNPMRYKKSTDYYNSVISTIIQAIGRLYRSECDTSKMFIYLDDNLKDSVLNFNPNNQTLLPAMKEIIDYTNKLDISIDTQDVDDRDIKQAINRFIISNTQARQHISYMLKSFSNQYTIEEWEEIREFIISNPTISTIQHNFNWLHEKLPQKYKENRYYFYTQEDDYKIIDISFNDDDRYKLEVSEQSALLDVVKNTQELQECIKNNKIALEFKHQYLMPPIVFNNIYKGALGEVIGRYLIEKYCDVELSELDTKEYERFDYKTDDKIYFDFKYFLQNTLELDIQKELVDKANYKLSSIGGKKALVVNIFAQIPTHKSRLPYQEGNTLIVPFLIDITNKEKPILDIEMLDKIKRFIR